MASPVLSYIQLRAMKNTLCSPTAVQPLFEMSQKSFNINHSANTIAATFIPWTMVHYKLCYIISVPNNSWHLWRPLYVECQFYSYWIINKKRTQEMSTIFESQRLHFVFHFLHWSHYSSSQSQNEANFLYTC